ncbi:MAG: DUF4913 domain-containing protein [Streptosporangiales bacterium]|nr:DUF4913 domain-containing protein [Streptosporangiales bacterium]
MTTAGDDCPPGDDPFAVGDDEAGAKPEPEPSPPKMGLREWVEQVFAPMVQRRVDLGRGRTWCGCWWAHPEVAVRLDALRLAWYELTAPAEPGGDPGAGASAWWVNHVDPTLMTLLDADTGPMSGCRPGRHSDSPVPPLNTESPDERNQP